MAIPTALAVGQIGKESTWGTAVAQTAILANLESLEIQSDTEISKWGRLGDLAANTNNALTMASGTASLTEKASYGQIGLWLQSLFGAATDAGAGPYTHTWEPDSTGSITRIFYTLLKSDATNAASLVGALVDELTLNFSPGEPVTADVSFVGKNVADGTITGSLSDFSDADQFILPSELTVYLDTVGSAGTTSLACDALEGSITFRVNTPLQHGLGTVAACNYTTQAIEIEASLVGNADNATIRTQVEALYGTSPSSSVLDLQLTFAKSANYDLEIIVPVVLDGAPTWQSDRDGSLTFDMSFVGVKNSSSSATNSVADIVLTNQDAVI